MKDLKFFFLIQLFISFHNENIIYAFLNPYVVCFKHSLTELSFSPGKTQTKIVIPKKKTCVLHAELREEESLESRIHQVAHRVEEFEERCFGTGANSSDPISHDMICQAELAYGKEKLKKTSIINIEVLQDPKHDDPSTHSQTKDKYKIPTTLELFKFVLPTVAMLQAPAIMSLVDTSVVGRQSSVDLAALGPGSQMCDAATYMFSFLGMSTANMVAGAVASENNEDLERIISHSFAMAIGVGMLVTSAVHLFGHTYLSINVGHKAIEVVPSALVFAKARIMGATAIMMTMVGQAASLGMKDSLTPLKVIAMNAIVNLFGDIFLVVNMGLGIWGAAVATALSEVGGAILMVRSVQRRFPKRKLPLIKVPSWADFKKFMGTGGPLFFMLWTRVVAFGWLSQTISHAGTAYLGSYQVILRLVFFFNGFSDALSLAAQAFLPFYHLRAATNLNAAKARRALVSKIMKLAVGLGLLTSTIACLVPLKFPSLFTTDALVISKMHESVPMMFAVLITYAICLPLEGILISMQDGQFLGKMYGAMLIYMVSYLEMVKRVPFFSKMLGISAWGGFVSYNVIRLTVFAARFLFKEKQNVSSQILKETSPKEILLIS